MDPLRRKKWLEVAKRYSTLNPEEQFRLQEKMGAWAALTPEQRKLARDRYKALAKLHPDARETVKRKWTDYDALTPEEKNKLAQRRLGPTGSAPAGGVTGAGSVPATTLGLVPGTRPSALLPAQPGTVRQ